MTLIKLIDADQPKDLLQHNVVGPTKKQSQNFTAEVARKSGERSAAKPQPKSLTTARQSRNQNKTFETRRNRGSRGNRKPLTTKEHEV
jgi:hypothetical protein